MTDELYDLPQPACGLSLVPVREIVVTAQPDGLVTRHDVQVHENGEKRWEYWCYDDASLQRALDYVTWLYPDAAIKE